MKISKTLTALLLAGAALFAGNAQADRIRIATEGAYAPFNFVDASGQLQGFDVDIAKALCEKMQADCDIVAQDWDGIIPGLQARRYDAIIASMSITPERQRVVAFTNPYYSNVLAFIGPKGVEFGTDADSLKGKTLGAQRATIAGQYLEDTLGRSVTVKLYDTQDNAYLDLAAGRLDGMVSDKFPAYDWLQSDAGQGFEFKGEDIDIDDKIAIAVRRQDNALRERLNKALAEILEDGTYAEINARYFPFPIY
ncbi:MAG TPA: ABC transporter substrate-binding protein [Azoarcus taiwanensis]|uniref:Transporter substrate-binding domain-containing protein n=1 Tax=Azoarcus taiwanensis TaxID=666964 RepID=A0A972F9L6_9RHOO|nr:ABC transporter substrate-binding protein [Azoarcus taiwanensis]NMG02564.1 transporter substrate-binding domain-containing protein [Azoarcus taiwanensis]HRQ55912.1 ABC transporter substrate-binding protein [Azoarcus taiwanensis]